LPPRPPRSILRTPAQARVPAPTGAPSLPVPILRPLKSPARQSAPKVHRPPRLDLAESLAVS
jgi:hypothetical protein